MVTLKKDYILIELENGESGYSVVSDYINAYWKFCVDCADDVLIHLETSFDGNLFHSSVEIVELYGTELTYLNDWWEGEKYIKIYGISNVNELTIPQNYFQLYYVKENNNA